MLIEQAAYANRWRRVAPGAKAVFALAGFVAAFAARVPLAAVTVALLIGTVTVVGARVSPLRYLRVAAPALVFLAISCLSLAFSVDLGGNASPSFAPLPGAMQRVAEVGARSLGALAALLFLVLTTPLPDLVAVLRRFKTPEVLLEIMVLCYRMLFVFSQAVHETLTAQSARLGYATNRLALRSLGALTANLTLQIWQRAADLHVAAQARNNDGPLRFLEPTFANRRRDVAIAAAAGGALVVVALWLSRWMA